VNVAPAHAQSVVDTQCQLYEGRPDDERPEVCRESQETEGADASDSSFLDFVTEFVDILLIGIGVIAVIMIIIGGLKYVTSTGDPAKTNSARNTIIYALVGLVVAVVSRLIILFVLDRI